MKSTLIIGGARSGKSNFAQELALKSGGAVLFVATAEAGDEEMKQRIEAHRKARPSTWETLEATTGIGRRIARNTSQAKTVIIDCVTLLVNNIIQQHSNIEGAVEKEAMAEINELVDCIHQSSANFIIVTNEVGLGLVPVPLATAGVSSAFLVARPSPIEIEGAAVHVATADEAADRVANADVI